MAVISAIAKLPLPSIVIASENDAYVDINSAKYYTAHWRNNFTGIGANGHIDSDTNRHYWEEGQKVLQQLKEVTHNCQMLPGV